MNRSVIVYAGLLCALLGGAYYAWTHEEQFAEKEGVEIVGGQPDDLESVVFRSKKAELTLTVHEDEFGDYVWVKSVPVEGATEAEPEPPEPADPHADPHAEPPAPPAPAEPKSFKAGVEGDTLLESLAPFRAKRVLEGLDETKLSELGFDEPDGTLVITRKGREPQTFDVGGNVYGGGNVYVRDSESGKVYVVDARVIRPLQSGNRTLPDRSLVGSQLKDIVTVTVQSEEGSATFEQHNPDDPSAMFWATAGQSEANEAAAAWIDKALRMRSADYVEETAAPTGLQPAFTLEVKARDGKTTHVAIFRAPPGATPEPDAGAGPNAGPSAGEDEWFAKSEHTRSLVKLHRALAAEANAGLAELLGSGSS